MTIADIDLATEEVKFPNGASFSVRGLSLEDVAAVVRIHGEAVQGFFLKYSGQRERLQQTGVAEAGLALLQGAPALAAYLIATAADEPELTAKVQKFPMGVQMDALEKIAKLTFDAAGGPKKFFEAVVRLLQGTTGLMTEFNQSRIGSLVSEDK